MTDNNKEKWEDIKEYGSAIMGAIVIVIVGWMLLIFSYYKGY